jgi:mannose-6-phosphate isomerase-like protein (cupin superfamily)
MNIVTLETNVPIEAMIAEVLAHPEAWDEAAAQRRAGQYHVGSREDGTYIPLVRSTNTQALVNGRCGWADNMELHRTNFYDLYPSITQWIESKHPNFARVWLFKIIGKGLGIVPHADTGAYYRAHDRFHLCLQGTYKYIVGDEEQIINAGDFIWFDSQKIHTADNIGDVDRISVVFDVPKK